MKSLVQYWVTERPLVVILMIAIFILFSGFGIKDLYFRGDYKIFFEEGYEPLEDLDEMQREFDKNDNILILIVPNSENVINQDILNLVYEYTNDAWHIPYSSRVDSITNFQYSWAEGDEMIVEDMVYDVSTLNDTDLQRIRSVVLNEPSLAGRLIDPEARVTTISVTLQMPDAYNNTKHVVEIMEYVKGLSEKYAERYSNVEFYHSGVIPINYSFAKQSQKDMSSLVPVMLGLIILILVVFLRSVLGVFMIVATMVCSVVVTMGVSGWGGFFLSTATVNVPIVVFTIAVADCVHIFIGVQDGIMAGMSRKEAVRYSLNLNWMPIFITSSTTAVGFGMLMMSESPVFVDFGIMSAVGVVTAYLLSITLFSSLLTVTPIASKKGVKKTSSLFMSFISEFVIRNRNILFFAGVTLIFIMGCLSFNNTVNDESSKYFAKSTEFRQGIDIREEYLAGTQSMDWAIYSNEAGGISDPDFIAFVNEFSTWMRSQPEVDHVYTISDIYKNLNKNMHQNNQDYYRVPEERDLAAQYLLLYEMSLPYGLGLNNQINIDKSAVRIFTTIKNMGSREVIALEKRAKKWVSDHAPEVRVAAASPTLMFAHISEKNMKQMLMSTFIALLIISFILIFALRSFRIGIISLFPNVLPALVGFGFWSLISGEINLGLSIVSSLTIGIIVDDTVHFLSKYIQARQEGMNSEEAVRHSFSKVGRALMITTIALSVGFSLLGLSSFRLNSDMGILTALIILIALVIDFIVLPSLLLLLDRKNKIG